MSEIYATKAKFDSVTIKGFLVLLIPFAITILKMFGVELPENFGNEFLDNVMKIIDGLIYFIGLIMVYKGRKNAALPLKGGLFSGWRK